MTIHFEIPKDIEERLRAAGINLTQMAKEAALGRSVPHGTNHPPPTR